LEDFRAGKAASLGIQGLKKKTKNMVSVFNYLNFKKVEAQT
jgi:hypothetical protein